MEDWKSTRISFAIIFTGEAQSILELKENLPSILPSDIKVVYQERSLLPLFISTEKPKDMK